jgi:hypothetical protein
MSRLRVWLLEYRAEFEKSPPLKLALWLAVIGALLSIAGIVFRQVLGLEADGFYLSSIAYLVLAAYAVVMWRYWRGKRKK